MQDDAVSEHLEKMAEFSENWCKQVSPVLESVERHSKGLAAQVVGLQPLIQQFSESMFQAKDKMIDQDQVASVIEDPANMKKEVKNDNEKTTKNSHLSKQ